MQQNKTDHIKEKAPVKQITHEALHDLIHFDNKLFRTVPALLFKPGKLTLAALKGNDSNYVRPLALFVFVNFLFFILKSPGLFAYKLSIYANEYKDVIQHELAEKHVSIETLTERFNTAMHFEQKEYMVIMVPLFALALQLLFLLRRQHYTRHLVFSLHFYTFFIIFLMVIPLFIRPLMWLGNKGFPALKSVNTEGFLVGTIVTACFIYLILALKQVYGGNIFLNGLKALLLSFTVVFLIVFVYRTLMFYIVMHAIA